MKIDSKMTKLERLNQWLELHHATHIRDLVFDGNGMITTINKGALGLDDYYIYIMPVDMNHNLGTGAGTKVVIEF